MLKIPGLLILILSVSCSERGLIKDSTTEQSVIWEELAPFFQVPEEFSEEFGSYKSPLTFYDGSVVTSSEDWERRREEILDHWHNMMGPWPPLIKDQEFEILWESTRKDGFSEYYVSFYWTPDEKTEGYLLIPDGEGIKPAVITVFYQPQSAIGFGRSSNIDFAYQLTKRGFVTLSIGTTQATEDRTYSLYYPNIDNAQVQPLSMLGYAAANAWHVLAKLSEVDSSRIGIVGHSFGGKWAMFASCLYDKFACAAWSDGGIVFDDTRGNINYWEPWYLGYHPPPWRTRGIPTADNPAVGLYPKLRSDNYDLHELHALMAPRPFLVSGGSEDPPKRWIPLNHTIKVNQLLGYNNRVAMTNREEHSLNPEASEQIYLFFEYFLKHDNVNP